MAGRASGLPRAPPSSLFFSSHHGSCVFLSLLFLLFLFSLPSFLSSFRSPFFLSFLCSLVVFPSRFQSQTNYINVVQTTYSSLFICAFQSIDRRPPLCLHQTLFSPHCVKRTNCIIPNWPSVISAICWPRRVVRTAATKSV